MNKLFKTIFTVLAFLGIGLALLLPIGVNAQGVKGTIDTIAVDSIVTVDNSIKNSLTNITDSSVDAVEEYNIYVYTPVGYTTTQKYDTLYILEGLYSTENDALDLTHQEVLEELISDEGIPPMIVVVIPECVYSNADLSEIIAKVDSLYSTKKDSSGRIISGFSNGAYFIWWQILANPYKKGLADTYIPMSPIGCRTIIDGETAFQTIRNDTGRIRIFNTCGNSGCEENYRNIYGGAEQMELILETGTGYGYFEGVNIFQYQAEGDHNWDQAWRALEEVLPRAVRSGNTLFQ